VNQFDAARRTLQRDRALRRAFVGSGITRIVTLAFSIASLAAASKGLDVERFGVFSVIYSASMIAAMADLGVSSGLVSKLSRAHGQGDQSQMRASVASAAVLLTMSGIAIVAVSAATSSFIDPAALLGVSDLPDRELSNALWTGVICLALGLPLSLGQRVDIALQRGAESMTWMMAGSAATLVGCVLALLTQADLWLWIMALLGGPVVAYLAQSLIVLRNWTFGRRPHLRDFERVCTIELIRVAAQYFVLGLAAMVTLQSGVLIVSHLEGAVAAGILGLTVRMFGIVTTTLTVSTRQFWPAASEAFAAGNPAWVRSRFKQTLVAAGGLGLAGSLVLLVVGRSLIRVWAGNDLVPSWSLLALGATVSTYAVIITQFNYLLNAAHVIKPQVWIGIVLVGVTLPMSWALTNELGLVGPYVAQLVANLLVAFVPILVLARRVIDGRLSP
jgi:O-antigen/teichoic acid export membrane protein